VRLVVVALLFIVSACAVTVVPTAKSYLKVSAPYELLPPTPGMVSALEEIAKDPALSRWVRDSVTGLVRDPRGQELPVFVLGLKPGLGADPSVRQSLLRQASADGPARETLVGAVTVYLYVRGGSPGATWIDKDFNVVVRGETEDAVVGVARAILSRQ
jgi:hypothetical protein